ncbi:MAG TPA: tetratricopeptide repeat protein [Chondromyces sp.]|nr:tetratricopeptide repeat protein [Chondromyces sp.]
MTGRGYRGRVILASAAVAVMAAETAGWWWWQQVQALARVNPAAAAGRLRESGLAALPPMVARARRLPTAALESVPRPNLAALLDRFGGLQRAWLPAHPGGFTDLARAELVRGRVNEAGDHLDAALARSPTSARLQRMAAAVLLMQGELAEALEALAVAEAIAPGLRSPPVQLIAEQEARVRVRALELRDRYYPRRRVDNALALARALRTAGDAAGAEDILAAYDQHPEVQLERARWALADGDRAGAAHRLDGVIANRACPRGLRSRAWSMLALVRELEGDGAGALAAADRALALEPESPHPWMALAALAESRGDFEAALGHLRRAWGMSPTDVGLLTRIARVAEQAGRPADALLALERAVEVDPDSSAAAARLVALQIRQGRYAEAAITVSLALDRHPTDPVLLELTERLRREIGAR